MSDFAIVSKVIRGRRAIFPKSYTSQVIEQETINEILEAARWAPTHKRMEPWRFVVFRGNGRQTLSDFIAEDYKNTAVSFSEVRQKQLSANPLLANVVIAIIVHINPDSGLPEWEEYAATACAVQNMWLTASSLGIGAYWSTPGLIQRMGSLIDLEPEQKCIGLFYMGIPEGDVLQEGIRKPVEEFTKWVE